MMTVFVTMLCTSMSLSLMLQKEEVPFVIWASAKNKKTTLCIVIDYLNWSLRFDILFYGNTRIDLTILM